MDFCAHRFNPHKSFQDVRTERGHGFARFAVNSLQNQSNQWLIHCDYYPFADFPSKRTGFLTNIPEIARWIPKQFHSCLRCFCIRVPSYPMGLTPQKHARSKPIPGMVGEPFWSNISFFQHIYYVGYIVSWYIMIYMMYLYTMIGCRPHVVHVYMYICVYVYVYIHYGHMQCLWTI